ncbi:putative dna repair protein rad57 protein [Cladorrhinum sp. PSN332]|nr:putative dna repair protein rad57 protein [Cladorrhinum sp. PSN332]
MTDLLRVLPNFPVQRFSNLISAVESQGLTTTDLITLEAAEVGKRTHLPLLEIKRLCAAVLDSLHADLGVGTSSPKPKHPPRHPLRISTLSPPLDAALNGGIPTSAITEITGESGAGKTQFLLTLLLSAQLPPSHGGLSRGALYISTEAALSTRRLSQILNSNPFFSSLPSHIPRPSLDNIISTCTPDLESQEHILTFQVPVEIQRRNIGLLVIDSIAANYRAEFDRKSSSSSSLSSGANMGARTADLIKTGMHLRDLAQKYDLAVVVSNQVADRFGSDVAVSKTPASSLRISAAAAAGGGYQDSPLLSRSRNILPHPPPPSSSSFSSSSILHPDPSSSSIPQPPPPPTPYIPPPENPHEEDEFQTHHHPALMLDHQQRWFTGWGDDPLGMDYPLKTPSLGLVWSAQISGRIALFRRPVHTRLGAASQGWKRWMKVVWGGDMPSSSTTAAAGGEQDGLVEFEVWMGGLRGVGGVGGGGGKEQKEKEKEEEEKEEEL